MYFTLCVFDIGLAGPHGLDVRHWSTDHNVDGSPPIYVCLRYIATRHLFLMISLPNFA